MLDARPDRSPGRRSADAALVAKQPRRRTMPKIAKQETQDVVSVEGYEGRFAELDGYTVAFETYTADADLAELFKGLPDDRCQCPHWGVVLKGKLGFRYADGSEDMIEAGEAYYARPGHTPVLFAGTQNVEFSPSAHLAQAQALL